MGKYRAGPRPLGMELRLIILALVGALLSARAHDGHAENGKPLPQAGVSKALNVDPLGKVLSNISLPSVLAEEGAELETPGQLKSEYRGVFWDPHDSVWHAQLVMDDGRHLHLGRFGTEKAAA